MARGYAPGGPLTPFYVFPCGHAFHAQCLIAHVTRSTSQTHVSWKLLVIDHVSLFVCRRVCSCFVFCLLILLE